MTTRTTKPRRRIKQPESKQDYLARRKARVRELFLGEGLSPRQIAAKLVKEGAIATTAETLDSAVRLVRSDIAEIRKDVDESRHVDTGRDVAPTDVDRLERELERLRRSYAKQWEIADDESIVTTTTKTPNGPIIIQKPKWPPGVRQKAAKDAATIAREISQLEGVLANQNAGAKKREVDRDTRFQFVFPHGGSLKDMIADNVKGTTTVN